MVHFIGQHRLKIQILAASSPIESPWMSICKTCCQLVSRCMIPRALPTQLDQGKVDHFNGLSSLLKSYDLLVQGLSHYLLKVSFQLTPTDKWETLHKKCFDWAKNNRVVCLPSSLWRVMVCIMWFVLSCVTLYIFWFLMPSSKTVYKNNGKWHD